MSRKFAVVHSARVYRQILSTIFSIAHQVLTVQTQNDIEILSFAFEIEIQHLTSCGKVLLVLQERKEGHIPKLTSLNVMVHHAIPVICRHKQVHLWWRLRIRESIFHLSLQHILAHSSLNSWFLLVKQLLWLDLSMWAFFLVDTLSSSRCLINAKPLIRSKDTKVRWRLSQLVALAADPQKPRFRRELIFIQESACLSLFFEHELDLLRTPVLLSLSECDSLFLSTSLILRGSELVFGLLRGQKELDLANVAWYVAGEILAEFRMLEGTRVMMLGTSPRVILDLKNLNLPELSSDGNQTVVFLNVVHVNVEDIWVKFTLASCEKVLGCIIHLDGVSPLAIRFQIYFIDVQLRIIAWHDQVAIVVELKLFEGGS